MIAFDDYRQIERLIYLYPATWRFTERRVGNDLFGDMSHHLLEPMDTSGDIRPQRWERA